MGITSLARHIGSNEQCRSSAPAAQSAEKSSALELDKVVNKRREAVQALRALHPGNWQLRQERRLQSSASGQRGLFQARHCRAIRRRVKFPSLMLMKGREVMVFRSPLQSAAGCSGSKLLLNTSLNNELAELRLYKRFGADFDHIQNSLILKIQGFSSSEVKDIRISASHLRSFQ